MKVTLIILAGGKATRMKQIGSITPKSLLNVFDQPLIIRQVIQASEQNINNIIISTRPELQKQFKKVVELYVYPNGVKPQVLANKNHNVSSLHALLFVLEKVKEGMIILSFGDMFFYTNPFKKISLENRHNCLNLCFSQSDFNEELKLGGNLKIVSGLRASHITYLPVKDKNTYVRWNGLASLDATTFYKELKIFITKSSEINAEEDFFQYLIDKGIKSRGISCKSFINVNSVDELLSASLIRYSENCRKNIKNSVICTSKLIRIDKLG